MKENFTQQAQASRYPLYAKIGGCLYPRSLSELAPHPLSILSTSILLVKPPILGKI